MRFQVHGERIQEVTVDVEAESEAQAFAEAEQAMNQDIEVWDVTTHWYQTSVLD